jgi:hypothetical protein
MGNENEQISNDSSTAYKTTDFSQKLEFAKHKLNRETAVFKDGTGEFDRSPPRPVRPVASDGLGYREYRAPQILRPIMKRFGYKRCSVSQPVEVIGSPPRGFLPKRLGEKRAGNRYVSSRIWPTTSKE